MKTIRKVLFSLLAILVIGFVGSFIFIMNLCKKMDKVTLASEVTKQTIPFYWSVNNHMLVDVKINNSNTSYPFLLDSGASTMVFGNLLVEHNLPDIGNGFSIGTSGGFIFPDIYGIDSLDLEGIFFKEVSAKSINELPMNCSDEVYGILGKEAMQHLVWQIDFEKEEITITFEKEQLTISKEAIIIPLEENPFGHQLYVKIQLGDDPNKKKLTVDLGSNGYASVKIKDVEKQTGKIIEFIGSSSTGLDGDYNKESYLQAIPNVKVGDLVIPNIPVYASHTPMNLLGLSFFRNFKTTISWKDKELILEPYEQRNFQICGFGYSARFNETTDALLIKSVCKGLPADSLGIRPGDTVRSINGQQMNTESQYCNFSYKDLKQVTLELERDGTTRAITLQRQDFFPVDTLQAISME